MVCSQPAGTTLGLLRVPGVHLGPKHRVFDTPGVAHCYQLTSLLQPDEVKMLLPRRKLKGRTYRIGTGKSLLIGAIARVDIVDITGSTVYLTAFISVKLFLWVHRWCCWQKF